MEITKSSNQEKEERRGLRQKLASRKDWEDGIGACQSDEQIIPRLFADSTNYLQPHSRVLDIGPGSGAELAALPCLKVALDISQRNLLMAKERVPDAYLILGDAENLPFKSEIFDAVIMLQVVHHLPNHRKAFEDTHRVLKYGGRLLIEDENGDAYLIIYPLIKLAMLISHFRGHYSEGLGMPLKKGLKTLAEIGFSIESVASKGSAVKGFWFSVLTRSLYRIPATFSYRRQLNFADRIVLALDKFLRRVLPPRLLMWYKLAAVKCAPGVEPAIAPIKREY